MAIAALGATDTTNSTAARLNSARSAGDSFGQALSTAGAALASSGAAVDPTSEPLIHLEDMRRAAELSLAEFKRMLRQALADAGVDTSQPIRLESDGHGGITLVGDHPDRDKIEKIFEESPDLVARFSAIAKRFTDVRNAENGPQSSQPLIQPNFGLSILDDECQVAFA